MADLAAGTVYRDHGPLVRDWVLYPSGLWEYITALVPTQAIAASGISVGQPVIDAAQAAAVAQASAVATAHERATGETRLSAHGARQAQQAVAAYAEEAALRPAWPVTRQK